MECSNESLTDTSRFKPFTSCKCSEKAAPGSDPEIAALVVDFRKPELTADCVKDLLRSRHITQVVVVMNAPQAGQVDALEQYLASVNPLVVQLGTDAALRLDAPRCTILHTESNGGYAAALNIAFDFARKSSLTKSHFWLLNNDIRVSEASIESIVAVIKSDPLDRLLGTCLEDDEGIALPFQKVFWGPIVWPQATRKIASADSLVGASIVMSSARANALFPMDEDYFLNFEDTALCINYRREFLKSSPGEEPFLVAGSVMHNLSTSQGEQSHLQTYYYFRNLLRFARKMGLGNLFASACPVVVALIFSFIRGDFIKGRVIALAGMDYFAGYRGAALSARTRSLLAKLNLVTSYSQA